jgi:hypothetical protein
MRRVHTILIMYIACSATTADCYRKFNEKNQTTDLHCTYQYFWVLGGWRMEITWPYYSWPSFIKLSHMSVTAKCVVVPFYIAVLWTGYVKKEKHVYIYAVFLCHIRHNKIYWVRWVTAVGKSNCGTLLCIQALLFLPFLRLVYKLCYVRSQLHVFNSAFDLGFGPFMDCVPARPVSIRWKREMAHNWRTWCTKKVLYSIPK